MRIVGYTLLFAALLYAAWTGAWMLEQAIESRGVWLTSSGQRSLYWLLMKLLLWIIPSMLFIRWTGRRVGAVMGLGRVRAIFLWGGGVGLALGLTTVIVKLVGHQPFFASPLGWALFSGVIVAPVVEEITFRGAILGALERRFPFGIANAATSLLFLGAHLPGWYFQGCLWANLKTPVGGALSIFLLGLVFGYVAHRSRSVAAGTLTHALNNLFNS